MTAEPKAFAELIAKSRKWPADYDLTYLTEAISTFDKVLENEAPGIRRDYMTDIVAIFVSRIEADLGLQH